MASLGLLPMGEPVGAAHALAVLLEVPLPHILAYNAPQSLLSGCRAVAAWFYVHEPFGALVALFGAHTACWLLSRSSPYRCSFHGIGSLETH